MLQMGLQLLLLLPYPQLVRLLAMWLLLRMAQLVLLNSIFKTVRGHSGD